MSASLSALLAKWRQEADKSESDAAEFGRRGNDWRDALTMSASAACYRHVAVELEAALRPVDPTFDICEVIRTYRDTATYETVHGPKLLKYSYAGHSEACDALIKIFTGMKEARPVDPPQEPYGTEQAVEAATPSPAEATSSTSPTSAEGGPDGARPIQTTTGIADRTDEEGQSVDRFGSKASAEYPNKAGSVAHYCATGNKASFDPIHLPVVPAPPPPEGQFPQVPSCAPHLLYRIEVAQEDDDGPIWAAYITADGKEAGSGGSSVTAVGALAELCMTLIKVEEDKRLEAARVPPPGWQPIATLPKDGRGFLVYWPGKGKARAEIDRLGGWKEYSEILEFGERPATHWMPLPDPPAVADADRSPIPKEQP